MSIDPEDSMLEEALRGDLPSPDTEARLRRRLLAASITVGNGIATTTAAASGTATSAATASGLVAKLAGLSWGVKLGLAVAVAIPTAGLWLDGHGERQTAKQPAPLALPAKAAESNAQLVANATGEPTRSAETERAVSDTQRTASKSLKPALVAAPEPESAAAPSLLHPSQGDFGAPEAPARSPQVGSTLADETRLLDAAFAALAAGNRARAAELIHEHEARYPSGLLNKERERAKARLSELSRGE